MLSEKDDPWMEGGGPAFPTSIDTANDTIAYKGLTMRDWFAGQALAGMMAASSHVTGVWQAFASDAYAVADAMLERRKIKPEDVQP